MTPAQQHKERGKILQVVGVYHTAMVEARTDRLNTIVGEGFSLVHITGYAQPKDEWFGVIRSGEFDYHRIDIDEQSLVVSGSGSTAVVNGRGIFNATIGGMRRPWRLQFTLQLAKPGPDWMITHARYSTF